MVSFVKRKGGGLGQEGSKKLWRQFLQNQHLKKHKLRYLSKKKYCELANISVAHLLGEKKIKRVGTPVGGIPAW